MKSLSPARLCAISLAFGLGFSNARAQYSFSLDPASPTLSGAISPGDVLQAGPLVEHPGITLGLLSNYPAGSFDNLDALSFGAEPPSTSLLFSVDRVAVGAGGTPLFAESAPPLPEAAADVFELTGQGTHTRLIDEADLGLAPGFFGDDLDALAHAPRAPLTPSGAIYFSIDAWSQTNLVNFGNRADDILMAFPGSAVFDIFADGSSLGLGPGNDLDALALYDIVNPGVLDPGVDKALFSVSAFSPITYLQSGQGYEAGVPGKLSPGDVLFTDFDGTFSLFRSAASLGLRPDDNLDALDVSRIPEPSSLMWSVALLGVFALRWIRSTRNSQEVSHVA